MGLELTPFGTEAYQACIITQPVDTVDHQADIIRLYLLLSTFINGEITIRNDDHFAVGIPTEVSFKGCSQHLVLQGENPPVTTAAGN